MSLKKEKKIFCKHTRCMSCKQRRIKCISSNENSDICIYCLENNIICNRYKKIFFLFLLIIYNINYYFISDLNYQILIMKSNDLIILFMIMKKNLKNLNTKSHF